MLERLAEWWNAVELWLAQLWFPFQIALVMLVLLPLCWAAALLVDRAVDRVSVAVARTRPANAEVPEDDEPAEPRLGDPSGVVRGDRTGHVGPS